MAGESEGVAPGTGFEDRYETVGELGAGGFGRVIKARQRSTGQTVAVKVIRLDDRDTPEETAVRLQRLRREMELCATLSHPHIVRLIDSGDSVGGQFYAVFEYVPGKTLREVIDVEGALAPEEAVHLLGQVLDALSSAHAQGIVHRDLKPENIMITQTGTRRQALVLDFGLGAFSTAAPAEARVRLTLSGEMMGTPSYAAPEQLRGEAISPLSDIYSWGLILLECLTGKTAVSGRTAYEVLMNQLGSEPIAIPADLQHQRLERLLRAVTAKNTRERPTSIAPLLEALEEIHRDLAAAAREGRRTGAAAEADQRPLTLLCCNTAVVRSGDAEADIEDIDALQGTFRSLCARLAGEAGGIVVHAQSGTAQVAFGYPRVRENDARRAIRTALGILAEAKGVGREQGLELRVQIGAHSALGIVRPASAQRGEGYDIAGVSPLVASSLAARAAAGELLITNDTRALLRDEMECEPVGEIDAPGRTQRLQTFRVTGTRRRSVSATWRPETRLTGRSGELAHLVELHRRVEAGEGAVVFVQGEAGVGKSRLVRELQRRTPPDGGWIGCACVPEGGGSPLHPLVAWLQSIEEPIDRLLARLGFEQEDTLPLIASLLDHRIRLPHLSPERQREMTLSLLTAILLRMARMETLVLVIEDLHWADPTTLQLVQALVDEALAAPAEDVRLLMVLTARPDFIPSWRTGSASVIALGRLSQNEVVAMVRSAFEHGPTPPDTVVRQIAVRTDGVPLFVEEMMHALRAADGGLQETSVERIPETLQELLSARLDALSPSARETAQVAAALGREFRRDLLSAALDRDEWALRQDLAELLESRLVHPLRAAEERYVFKHALVRDAAHQSMVRAVRARVHARIADSIRAKFPTIAEQQPEVVALHAEEGGDLSQAAELWLRAGDRAFRRAAYPEAADHFARALSALARLPADTARAQREIEAWTMLGTAQASTRGHGDPEVRRAYSRARALCEEHGVEISLKILAGLVGAYLIEGDREAVETLLPRFTQLATTAADVVSEFTGVISLSIHSFWSGEHRRAEALLERGRWLYDTDDFRRYAEEYGWDGGIYIYAYSVWNRVVVGDPAGARILHDQLVERGRASVDLQALAVALGFGLDETLSRGDLVAVRRDAEELLALATKQRLSLWIVCAHCARGLAVALQGEPGTGIDEIRSALDFIRMAGARTFYGHFLPHLATAQLAAGRVDDGLATVREGLALCSQDLARAHEPELLRLEGELLQAGGDPTAAEDRLARAQALAADRGALIFELRAAVSLARLLVPGDAAQAHDLLARICERFDPAVDVPDLRAARDLLATTAGAPHRLRGGRSR